MFVALLAALAVATSPSSTIGVHRHHIPPPQSCPHWAYIDNQGHVVRPDCAQFPTAHPGLAR